MPEIPFNVDDICQKIVNGYIRGKLHSIIIVAEGAASGFDIGKSIKGKTGFDTRVIVLGQRHGGGFLSIQAFQCRLPQR